LQDIELAGLKLGGVNVVSQPAQHWLLRWVVRLLALENPTGVETGHAIRIGKAGSVAHQAASFRKLAS
jgi:hypothetical protein